MGVKELYAELQEIWFVVVLKGDVGDTEEEVEDKEGARDPLKSMEDTNDEGWTTVDKILVDDRVA